MTSIEAPNDYLSFDGQIEPVQWGNATYTMLPVPNDVAAELLARGARRVEGEINDHPINLALSRAPVVDGVFLWTGKSLTDQLGVGPGERLEVRLRKAPDDAVDLPGDVAVALRAAGVQAEWEALTPGKRRGMLYAVSTAKRAATRARRIEALVAELASPDD